MGEASDFCLAIPGKLINSPSDVWICTLGGVTGGSIGAVPPGGLASPGSIWDISGTIARGDFVGEGEVAPNGDVAAGEGVLGAEGDPDVMSSGLSEPAADASAIGVLVRRSSFTIFFTLLGRWRSDN